MKLDRTGDNETVSIPVWFVERVVSEVREIEELQVLIAFFRLSGSPKHDQPVSQSDLIHDPVLNQSLRFDAAPRAPMERIERGLELAVARNAFLHFAVVSQDEEQEPEHWLLLATQENRVRLERYRSGQLVPPGLDSASGSSVRIETRRPGIFQLYEQNIGLVTPIIADKLVEALELYPETWIADAIGAAVSYNRRNWRYIERILETWATEGRSNEADRQHQPVSGTFDLERNLRGEYAAVFKRKPRS